MDLSTLTMKDMATVFLVYWVIWFLFGIVIKRFSSKDLPLPPGPYPWPIFGNLFQIKNNLLHVSLAEMAQVHGPLMSLRLGQQILIVGSTSNVALEILKTRDDVLSGRDVSRFIKGEQPNAHNKNLSFTSDCDDRWRLFRNIYRSEIFSNTALEIRTNIRESKVKDMMEYLGSKVDEVIAIRDVAFTTSVNVLGNVCLSIDLLDYEGNGIGDNLRESLGKLDLLGSKPLLANMYPILGQWDIPGWYKQVMHITEQELGSIWKDSIQMKRDKGNVFSSLQDFADTLIHKGFTNQQINPLIQELFAAGTESTTLTIEWMIVELLRNQEAMQKAKDEVRKHINRKVVKESDLVHLPFMEACYKETLRLHPSGPLLIPHKAIEACELMGYTIPKDSLILVNIWAINRDPNFWDDPLRFKPERFVGSKLSYLGNDFDYLPFGSGRRMCPGLALASKIVLLTIVSLIQNFDWFLPNNMNPDDINMDEEVHVAMHKKERLLISLKFRD
ncbi:probable (S)-N-methylcoclaurine 3'-hydroxylase isozyme 2 [Rutidosis leptorrhynchoides]|uniref:probable (S)-N-methylcoclaurine 3'-hydroxylase isozyme 2 n=1 Tax=Rutidosis leptorrhynchoides TaxID=125765 RepID=UPI003A9918A2